MTIDDVIYWENIIWSRYIKQVSNNHNIIGLHKVNYDSTYMLSSFLDICCFWSYSLARVVRMKIQVYAVLEINSNVE